MRRRTLRRLRSKRGDRRSGLFQNLRQGPFQRNLQHLVHGVDEVQLHLVAQVFRYLRQVFLVVLGQNHLEQSRAMGRQQFLLQSADRQYLATQRNFARHRDIPPHRNFAERAGNRSRDGDARRRSILGNSALGHVHVDIKIAIEIARHTQSSGPRAYIRHSRLRRLLHDVAQLPGQSQFAFAVDDSHFRAQDRAANFRPGQPCNQADFALLVGQCVAEFDYAQELANILPRDGNLVVRSFLDHFARDLAAYIADLAFQVAYASLPRVGPNDPRDGIVGELDVLVSQTSLGELLLHQKLLRDLDLLRFGVPMQSKYFHAVLQGRRNGVHHVGSRHEEYLRQVVFDVEVVIHEHEVLLGIEHFQQSR